LRVIQEGAACGFKRTVRRGRRDYPISTRESKTGQSSIRSEGGSFNERGRQRRRPLPERRTSAHRDSPKSVGVALSVHRRGENPFGHRVTVRADLATAKAGAGPVIDVAKNGQRIGVERGAGPGEFENAGHGGENIGTALNSKGTGGFGKGA
jgi:hypothetical protein